MALEVSHIRLAQVREGRLGEIAVTQAYIPAPGTLHTTLNSEARFHLTPQASRSAILRGPYDGVLFQPDAQSARWLLKVAARANS